AVAALNVVVAGAAVQRVVAGAADENVAAVAARQRVVACTAREHVVPRAARQYVVVPTPDERGHTRSLLPKRSRVSRLLPRTSSRRWRRCNRLFVARKLA